MPNLRKTYSDIYDKYVDKIYRFIFLKVKSAEIAEDLCSEVFLRGWEAFKMKNEKGKTKNEIENIQAFLYQISRNLLADHYRKVSRVQLVSTENAALVDPGQDLTQKAIINSDMDTVRAALANINEDYREVLVWYYLDELKMPEIAKMLNKSEEAARVMVHRALKALKNELK
jgi:RNA polymerase sigma-70 factor (ECF subfamily)